LYPFNFFSKPDLQVGSEGDAAIGSYVQENRERFEERCSILDRKVVTVLVMRERCMNKGLEVHLVS